MIATTWKHRLRIYHVVLIWTLGGHTYGVGFHNVQGLRRTLDVDVAFAQGIRLVAPVDSQ
jgi:hypothetical protein